MSELPDMIQIRIEWNAWQKVVFEFRSIGIDMNERRFNPLVSAICLWGEELHRLRSGQTADQQLKAFNDYKRQYAHAVAERLEDARS